MSLKLTVKKFNNKKVFTSAFLVLVVITLSFLIADVVFAENWAVKIIGGIISGLVYIFGWILMLVVRVLVYVAQYNNFIDARPIQVGWIMVRDLANMFFIVILLIIAFATILRIEKYNYKKWLPKLLLMAVLINFSRTICGLMIDVAQVVMLSFVNSFKDIGNYNFTTMLGIGSWGQFTDIDANDSNWDILAAYGLMLVYTVISLVVMIAMTAMLVMRIIMIWVYVVLSPLAFLLGSFPDGQSHASKWWSQFGQNLIIGPVLAFFIWLSFMTVNPDSRGYEILKVENQNLQGTTEGHKEGALSDEEARVGGVGQADTLLRFIVAIAMLLGGLKIAQDIGGQAGTVLGKVSNKGFAISKAVGRKTAGWAGRQMGDVRDSISDKIGVDLDLAAGHKRFVQQSQERRAIKKSKIRQSTLDTIKSGKGGWIHRKAALLSTGDLAYENLKQGKAFRGGSPKKTKKLKKELESVKEEIKVVDKDINNLESTKSQIVTNDEAVKRDVKTKNIENKKLEVQNEIKGINEDAEFKLWLKQEEDGSISDSDQQALDKFRLDISNLQDVLDKYDGQIDSLKYDKSLVVDSEDKKKEKITEIDKKISEKEKEKLKLKEEKVNIVERVQANKVADLSTAKSRNQADLEAEASKKITGTSSPEELIAIFNEAMRKGDTGMMAAVSKKLAKEGNYNELMESLDIGTGLEGMHELADKIHNSGGMSMQDSHALVAEIGEICKTVNHLQAWATLSMDETGEWKRNNYAEQQGACLAEAAKIQVQKFVRDFNRLGTGHFTNGEHIPANWVIDAATAKLFASKDKEYAMEMSKTGNINTIKFIASNQSNIDAIRKAGAVAVADLLQGYVNKTGETSVENPQQAIDELLESPSYWDKVK